MTYRPPVMASRCPRPWTPADERRFQRELARLRADIRASGGFHAWLETHMEEWLASTGPCRSIRTRARPTATR